MARDNVREAGDTRLLVCECQAARGGVLSSATTHVVVYLFTLHDEDNNIHWIWAPTSPLLLAANARTVDMNQVDSGHDDNP